MMLSLVLAACVSPSPYEAQNYKTLPWQKESFDQVKAYCRYHQTYRSHQGREHDIDVTMFKECMERYGYHYLDGTNVRDHADDLTLLPLSPDADKSALYK
jgi:hypothetical protein